MAPGVVDVLEIVQVEHEQGKLVPVPLGSAHFVFQHFVEVAPVVQPCQRIVRGVILQFRQGAAKGFAGADHHHHHRQDGADDGDFLHARAARAGVRHPQQAGQVDVFDLGHRDHDHLHVIDGALVVMAVDLEFFNVQRRVFGQMQLTQ